jgi:hypothetical protein
MHPLRVAVLCLAVMPASLRATDRVDYTRDIKPILRARCFACHGALKQKGKLRLDTVTLMTKGGSRGPAVQPGNAGASPLIERVTDPNERSRMPPQGKPLTATQIALLKEWINQGAAGPADEKPESDPRRHWAFVKPTRPSVPPVADPAWSRNPIDAFIAAEYARQGLTASPPAHPALLLRRVFLDLIGLPPTREEQHAFLADSTPDAYERVVERLLASPQYGERWGRHWMDVWRYSDWYGRRAVPDVMNSYARIWRWRDWIVASLNADKGYDRMIQEMLAADEIAPNDEATLVATGFLVRNWFKWNYNQWMRDNVEHTGKAFLGLTLNCCHCHDHKYDPITQEDYFRFRAFFEPLELRHDRWPGEPDPGPFQKYVYGASYGPIQSGIIRVMDEKLDAQTFLYTGGDERNRVPGKAPIAPGVPAAMGGDPLRVEPVVLPPAASYPGLKPFIQREELDKCLAAITAAKVKLEAAQAALARALPNLNAQVAQAETAAQKKAAPAEAQKKLQIARRAREAAQLSVRLAESRVAVARGELVSLQARIAADRVRCGLAPGCVEAVSKTASRAERQVELQAAQATLLECQWALAVAEARPLSDPNRGILVQKAAGQIPGAEAGVKGADAKLKLDLTTYKRLGPTYPTRSTGRRNALAGWIASKSNPLTARVAVNHLWGWHFGRPLVETTFNFGRSGKPPSHPELLDWLAVELMENGWRMKDLHRLLVTSTAYRMASRPSGLQDPNQAIDPDNRLLWHFPVQRMEAEVVRDSILATAGPLDRRIGGPEIPQEQGQSSHRRSLYFDHHGESRMEFLDLFDAANPCDCYRRTTSVLPQQALALSNSELIQHMGRILAHRLEAQTPEVFVQAAFEQVLGRAPTVAEKAAAVGFLSRQTVRFQQAKLSAAGTGGPAIDPALRAQENLVIALFSHNEFVTIR